MTVRLVATDIEKSWPGSGGAMVVALRSASLAVAAGETLAIVGPSGSGKTTLLAILGGLLRPDRGRVLLDGDDVHAAGGAAAIGFVFQRGLLVDHLTARENVALAARARGVPRADALVNASALLEQVGLAARRDAFPETLSPGEAQRVAVARAVITQPRLVLADEPTAHLDRATGEAVVSALRALCTARAAGLVLVTHDARLTAIADRTLHLDDGRLLQSS